ncbi:porin OmpA [Serratia sp. OS31]|uniref:porin OmpA n=1 Tax=Serratia sp. OS31 TaxID=2760844 RepID=UPI0015FEC1A6|nr:porin OmpA [Serratia sp. OS31]MBB1585004.1 porin OmpA [Serratia sp. OS31]
MERLKNKSAKGLACFLPGVLLGVVLVPAANAAKAGDTYLGAKASWSDYYNVSLPASAGKDARLTGSSVGGGAFLGYQFTDWLAVEGGYDYLGNAHIGRSQAPGISQSNHGIQLGIKLSAPLTPDWSVYARAGAMGWRSEARQAGNTSADTGVSPLAALGTEIALSDALALRLEYQYVASVGEGGNNGVVLDNGQTSLGIVYRFAGKPASAPVLTPVSQLAPVASAPRTFTLSADALFGFNSTVLTPAGQRDISQLAQQLQEKVKRTDNMQVSVVGHADRLGTPAYNQRLSQRRADAVAASLHQAGVPKVMIHTEGRGATESVTDAQCHDGLQRRSLIECLAPDRRVTVTVSNK